MNNQTDQHDENNALWYVISGGFANNPFSKETHVNPDASGVLALDATLDLDAMVRDAGAPVPGQS